MPRQYMYHITHASRMSSISIHGLLPGMKPNIGSNTTKKMKLLWLTPFPSYIILRQGLRHKGLHYILTIDTTGLSLVDYSLYVNKKIGNGIEWVTSESISPDRIVGYKTYFFKKTRD